MSNKEIGDVTMRIAVLIPCYNEALTVGKVISDFRRELPTALVYVYDNNSTDDTAVIAKNSGAIVKKEFRQGKGYVVRQMFLDIDADCYVLVDGDDTYPAEAVHSLVQPIIQNEIDMCIGDRLSNGTYTEGNKRLFHDFGNNLVRKTITFLFGQKINDVMTGYRTFSRMFVKSFPAMSDGFQIETEFTIHALDKKFRFKEIPIDYRDRPSGSVSKLNTFTDGLKVLCTIFRMLRETRPIQYFGALSLIMFILGILIGFPVIFEFLSKGIIDKIPSAVLASGVMIFSLLLYITGIILNAVVCSEKKAFELNLYRVYSDSFANKEQKGQNRK